MRWHLICWCPGRPFPDLASSRVHLARENAGITCFISFWIASIHKVLPFSLSNRIASSTVLGTLIPNFSVVLQYLDFPSLDKIRRRFRNTSLAHQANAGSSTILWAVAYSATSIGLDSLRSFNGIQFELPSFHRIRNIHPFVVLLIFLSPFLLVIQQSCRDNAASVFRWSISSSTSRCSFPSSSTWENILSAMMLAV